MTLSLLFVVLLMLGRHTSIPLFDRVLSGVGSALFTVVGVENPLRVGYRRIIC